MLDGLTVLLTGEEGNLYVQAVENVTLNWRFDMKKRKWVDVDTGEEFEEFNDETS